MDSDSCLCLWAFLFTDATMVAPAFAGGCVLCAAVLLLWLSGFISASEIAFFSLTSDEREQVMEECHPSDGRISKLLDSAERFQATLSVSNTIVNVVFVILLDYFFSEWICLGWGKGLELFFFTVASAFFLLLFGEMLPKIYAVQNALKFSRKAAPLVYMLYCLLRPVSGMLSRISEAIDARHRKRRYNLSVDELSHALELTDKNEISDENNILEGIIRFGGETAKEIMTSRLDMVDLDIKASFKEVLQCIIDNVYSRIPVYSGSKDNIKGVLYIKDLLPHLGKGDNFRWQSLIRPAYFVPETKMIDDLLRDFQANKIHIAIVVDEFGGTSGIVTMEDIIEEIVGEINDEYDEEERSYVRQDENTYIFEAKTQLTDFYRITKLDPEDFDAVSRDADTLAGLLLEIKGEFPALHEVLQYRRYKFEVLAMNDRRILKVKFTIDDDTQK